MLQISNHPFYIPIVGSYFDFCPYLFTTGYTKRQLSELGVVFETTICDYEFGSYENWELTFFCFNGGIYQVFVFNDVVHLYIIKMGIKWLLLEKQSII